MDCLLHPKGNCVCPTPLVTAEQLRERLEHYVRLDTFLLKHALDPEKIERLKANIAKHETMLELLPN